MWSARWDRLYSEVSNVSRLMRARNTSIADAFSVNQAVDEINYQIAGLEEQLLGLNARSKEYRDIQSDLRVKRNELSKKSRPIEITGRSYTANEIAARMAQARLKDLVNWFFKASGYPILDKVETATICAIGCSLDGADGVDVYFAPRDSLPGRNSLLTCGNPLHGHIVITRNGITYYRDYGADRRGSYHLKQPVRELHSELKVG